MYKCTKCKCNNMNAMTLAKVPAIPWLNFNLLAYINSED